MPDRLARSRRPAPSDAPVVALVLLGALVRARPSFGLPDLLALVVGVGVYAVLDRWGCWRWLAAVAAAPAILEVPAAGDALGPAGLTLALGSAVVVALCWNARPQQLTTTTAAVGVLALPVLLL